jgi:glycosyltransferase involved in cell wall biosynthesis
MSANAKAKSCEQHASDIFYLLSGRNTFEGTGIDRVTRSILQALRGVVFLHTKTIVVEIDDAGDFLVVNDLHESAGSQGKCRVIPGRDDVVLSVDLVYDLSEAAKRRLKQFRENGTKLFFVLHDLIPIRRPEWFMSAGDKTERKEYLSKFTKWVNFVFTYADALLCVSRHVLDDAKSFIEESYGGKGPQLYWFHHGVDPNLWGARVSTARAGAAKMEPYRLLMVCTLEPRKSQSLALDAFEILWREMNNFILVIAGRVGKPWMSNYQSHLVRRMEMHAERGRRLFFVEGASDYEMQTLYRDCDALLMLSEDEGFGIPLIEAAYCGLPIIVRDIPVFREVCGSSAYYLKGGSAYELSRALLAWGDVFRRDAHPKAGSMSINTWHESALQIVDALSKEGVKLGGT